MEAMERVQIDELTWVGLVCGWTPSISATHLSVSRRAGLPATQAAAPAELRPAAAPRPTASHPEGAGKPTEG